MTYHGADLRWAGEQSRPAWVTDGNEGRKLAHLTPHDLRMLLTSAIKAQRLHLIEGCPIIAGHLSQIQVPRAGQQSLVALQRCTYKHACEATIGWQSG